MKQQDEPLISVVVPVYKVEDTLDRCVESILAQTYANLEIILVDDGSPDRSGALCDAWAAKDTRIKVIHKENGGLSDARNAGARVAQGEYIGFVDSDDYIGSDMYRSMLELLRLHQADLALCGVTDAYADHVETPAITSGFDIMTPEEALSDIFLNKTLMVGVPPRLYPRALALEVPNPQGKTHEDAFVVVEQLMRTSRIVVDRTPHYCYWHNANTITSMPSQRALGDNIEAWNHNLALVQEHFPTLEQDVLFRVYWAHFDVLDGMMLSDQCDQKLHDQVISFLKTHKSEILRHPHVSSKRKLALRLLCIHESLYRLLVHAQQRRIRYNG